MISLNGKGVSALLRKFSCLILAGFFASCLLCSPAKALPPEIESISIYATGSFNFELPDNTARAATTSFPLERGEVVTIKGSYTPFSADIDFGLIAPDGRFYYLSTNDGIIDGAIEVDERGDYTLVFRNNSSGTISISGSVNY